MKKNIILLFILLASLPLKAQYTVEGGDGTPLLAEGSLNGQPDVYLLKGLHNGKITFKSSSPGNHQWYKYDSNGANEAIAIPSTKIDDMTSYISDIKDGEGYFVGLTNDPSTRYVWIIDYDNYIPYIGNLTVEEEEDKCSMIKIKVTLDAEPIYFYKPSGSRTPLLRKFHLVYNSMEWDENSSSFLPKEVEFEVDGAEIDIEAPLMNTKFTFSGDDFATHFGIEKRVTTADEYTAIAVDVRSDYELRKETGSNEKPGSEEGNKVSGSAPLDMTFYAYANEPVASMYIWSIKKLEDSGEFREVGRVVNPTANYLFQENGTYIAELEVLDSQRICTNDTISYNIEVGETIIKVPNFFSPGSSIGSNDEFKIYFQSVLKFKCSIFNRWGNLLYEWTDPTKGWDGRISGAFVATGAYYYIIEYQDTSGKSHKLSGSVNVLREKEQ